jgi:hypothetical protein
VIGEHHVGKARRSRERAFLAIHEHSADAAAGGRCWASADRQHLADHAGLHVRTFDVAVRDLEQLGLVEVRRRRVRRDLSLPNLWRSRPVRLLSEPPPTTEGVQIHAQEARIPAFGTPIEQRKPHTGTETFAPSTEGPGPGRKAVSRAYARGGTEDEQDEFRWRRGAWNHPALHGLADEDRWAIADAYELVRERLLDAGVVRVPEGGWLAAIRDYRADHGPDSLRFLDDALDDYLEWREHRGGLAYSFAWMHKYRQSPCPPPSLLFGRQGDERDHSRGETPLSFWANRQRSW